MAPDFKKFYYFKIIQAHAKFSIHGSADTRVILQKYREEKDVNSSVLLQYSKTVEFSELQAVF